MAVGDGVKKLSLVPRLMLQLCSVEWGIRFREGQEGGLFGKPGGGGQVMLSRTRFSFDIDRPS
jgi:hypothetical protein